MSIRCANHNGLPIYHETEADVQMCMEEGPVADYAPVTEGIRFPIAGTKAAKAMTREGSDDK